jgi:hypothetical protein
LYFIIEVNPIRCLEVRQKKSTEHFDGTTRAEDLEACNGVALLEFFYIFSFLAHFVGTVKAVGVTAFRTFNPTFIWNVFQAAGFTFFPHVSPFFSGFIVWYD